MRRNEAHEALIRDILRATMEYPHVRLWRNDVGRVQCARTGRWVHYGLGNGTADLIGHVDGRFFAIEVKTGRARTTKAQAAFIHHIEETTHGLAVVARAVDECFDIIT